MDSVTRVMKVSIITNIFLSLVKIIFGFLAKSSALIADGVSSFSDLLTDIFAVVGNIVSKKPADKKHPYGYGKVEYLTSIGIGLIILILGFSILYNLNKSSYYIFSSIVVAISVISIFVKLILSDYIIKKGYFYKNNILIASGKESEMNVMSSVIVLLSAILSTFSGYIDILKYADLIASIIVGILIIKTGFLILKENMSTLIGEQSDNEEIKKIRRIIKKNKQIKKIDNLVVIKYGYCYKVSLEVSMDSKLNLLKCHDIIDNIEQEIKNKVSKVKYITTHVNPYDDVD